VRAASWPPNSNASKPKPKPRSLQATSLSWTLTFEATHLCHLLTVNNKPLKGIDWSDQTRPIVWQKNRTQKDTHPHFSAFDVSALEGFSASRRTNLWIASPLMSISWSYNTEPEMMSVTSVRFVPPTFPNTDRRRSSED
jgi:hypothetical protein